MTAERYPGLRILDQSDHWDEATRDVIMDRVHNVPPVRHFSGEALRTLEALCECIVPQVDRPADRRVAIAPWIDAQLEHAAPEGFRFDDMPALTVAWGRGLEGLNESAVALFGRAFPDLDADGRRTILEAVRAGTAAGETWQQIPARRWWIYVALREILGVYFAHPFAWDEIGFGGPAFPRGYASLNHGAREWWEQAEDPAALAVDRQATDAALARQREGAGSPHGGSLGTPHGMRPSSAYSAGYPDATDDPAAAADPTRPPDPTRSPDPTPPAQPR